MDKTCPKYAQEARFLKFKCEHHLGFSEARKQFPESGYAGTESYAHAVSASLSSPVDYTTKTDLQEMFQACAESIAAIMQSVLDA